MASLFFICMHSPARRLLRIREWVHIYVAVSLISAWAAILTFPFPKPSSKRPFYSFLNIVNMLVPVAVVVIYLCFR